MAIVEVLNMIFGGTSLLAIITFLIFFKLNKRGKMAEVKGTEEDTEAKNIANENSKLDLGDRYIESIMKLQTTFDTNTNAVKEMSGKIDRVLDEQLKQGRLIEYIRLYLNGGFDEWLKNNNLKDTL